MGTLTPIYTADNCRAAYQLNWSLAVFWTAPPPAVALWLNLLSAAAESDGVRILEHRFADERVSQFLISTRPETAPPAISQCVKGRLQHIVRAQLPRAFRRNYAIRSVGSATSEAIGGYIRKQPQRHVMADDRVQQRFERLQICGDPHCLVRPRTSGHAQFWYNLHLVLVSHARDVEVRVEILEKRRAMILAAAEKKGHLVGNGHLLSDHMHVALGCNLNETPREVALSYLNNLAFTEGMRITYEFGFYVGTFGEYDLGAVWQSQ